MRLSEWEAEAPSRETMSAKVMDVLRPVLAGLGSPPDPHCWVAWGDDPRVRYQILAVAPAGLAMCNVRVNVPGEGPRASGKLARWSRLQVGELDVEAAGGHRHLGVQVEGQVLRAVDGGVDRLAAFVQLVLAGMDGRALPGADPADPGPTTLAATAGARVGARSSRGGAARR